MRIGLVGLGRMGGNIVRWLMRAGHSCVVYDKSTEAVAGLAGAVDMDASSAVYATQSSGCVELAALSCDC